MLISTNWLSKVISVYIFVESVSVSMNFSLKSLVVITCVALAGIIGLQSFWLVQAYQKAREQLFAAASTSLVEHEIQTGIGGLLSSSIKLIDSLGKDEGQESKMQPAYLEIDMDSLDISTLLQSIYGDKRKEYSLPEYHKSLALQFATRGIDIPFEVALVNSDNVIIACTVDSALFNTLTERTKGDYSLPVHLNKEQTGVIVVAFHDVPYHLLKNMWVVLGIAILLTIVCVFSFYQLVSRFFKEKKLALLRNDFMNNMTHELKTPVSTASLAIQLLQDQSVIATEQTRSEYLSLAKNELSRLAMLIDKVLKIAAFERTDVGLNVTSFKAEQWLEKLLLQLTPLTDKPDIQLIAAATSNLEIKADQEHLSGVLYNLIENSVKYRDVAKPIAHIELRIQEIQGLVKITVADNGIGIAPDFQSKIFDKFFRVPKGDTQEIKGYGLGLSYVQEVVLLHSGSIMVDSKVGRGTTFTIQLPN